MAHTMQTNQPGERACNAAQTIKNSAQRSVWSQSARLLAVAVVGGLVCAGSLHMLGGQASTPAFAQATGPARLPNTIAIVNLQTLMGGLKELEDLNKELDPTRAAYKAQLDELDTRIKALEVELKDNIAADKSLNRTEKALQFSELRNVKEFREKSFLDLMDARNGEILQKVYVKLLPSISAYAKREGIDLVLLDDRGIPVPPTATASQINNIILSKRILHADDKLDITQALITVINNEYATGTAGTP
jgi:Skp family chaperone for outer membrane proteins